MGSFQYRKQVLALQSPQIVVGHQFFGADGLVLRVRVGVSRIRTWKMELERSGAAVNHRSFDHVLQLADVARPQVLLQFHDVSLF